MKIGIALDLGSTEGLHGQIERAVGLLGAAEQAGLDSVWLGESYHDRPRPFHLPAPLITLAHLAPRTTLKLGTGVLLFRAYEARRLALEAALVDQLSVGRLSLGIGLGNADLRGRIGYEGAAVGSAFEECLVLLKRAWSEDGNSGAPFRSVPAPVQVNGPPVLVGGGGPRAVYRAATYADGYYGATNYSDRLLAEQARAYWGANRSGIGDVFVNRLCMLRKNGDEARSLERMHYGPVKQSYAKRGRWGMLPGGVADSSEGAVLAGSASEVVERLHKYASWGVTGVQVRVAPLGLSQDVALKTIELIGEGIIPEFPADVG